MNLPDIVAATTPVVEALEQLGVTYHIGGSVASSIYGLPRLTIDIDIIADLRLEHVRPLVKRLEPNCYSNFLFQPWANPCYHSGHEEHSWQRRWIRLLLLCLGAGLLVKSRAIRLACF